MNLMKRIADRLDAYFNNKNDENWVMPTETIINFSALQEVFDDCFLVQVQDDKFKFPYMGKNIIDAIDKGIFGKEVEQIILPGDHAVAQKFSDAVKAKKPRYFEDRFIANNTEIKYRMKIYPLTDIAGGDNVKFLFGGMRWKAEI